LGHSRVDPAPLILNARDAASLHSGNSRMHIFEVLALVHAAAALLTGKLATPAPLLTLHLV